jgi:cytidylate kinase
MTVIVMSCELGSRGEDVIASLALGLCLRIVDHGFLAQHIGQRIGLEDISAQRFLEERTFFWERRKIDPRRFSRFAALEILEFAVRGNVIIHAWGAVQLLADMPHVIRVRVCAPMDNRIDELVSQANKMIWEMSEPIAQVPEIVRERMVVSRHDAQRKIQAHDLGHANLVCKQFRRDWKDPVQYDIVLDTANMSTVDCVFQVRELISGTGHQETEQSVKLLRERWLATSTQARGAGTWL